MFATATLFLCGAILSQAASPVDLGGAWKGEQWGQVQLSETKPGIYTGTSHGKQRSIKLKWSRTQRRFNGTWNEGETLHGKISIRLVDGQIRGAWTTARRSQRNPATPRLAELFWTRNAPPMTTLGGHLNHVNSSVFSPDGKILAAGDAAGQIILWNLSTNRKLLSLANVQVIECVDFSPDGRTLVTADRSHAIAFWDVATGQEKKRKKAHAGPVMSVVYSPAGELVASAGADQVVKIWDSSRCELLAALTGHTNAIQEVVFSPDGRKLASIDLDGWIKVWDSAAGELLYSSQADRSGMGLAFSPNGGTLAAAMYPPKIQLFEVASGNLLRTLMGHQARVRDVAFSPDGRLLASAGDDQTVRLWEVESGRQLHVLSGHNNQVHDVEFSPDGKTIASGSADQTSRLWLNPSRAVE